MHALTGLNSLSMQRRQVSGAARAGDRHRCDWLDRTPAPAPPTGGALACARRACSATRCDAHSSRVYRQRMLRMRSLSGTRLHSSSMLSSLLSTLPQ